MADRLLVDLDPDGQALVTSWLGGDEFSAPVRGSS